MKEKSKLTVWMFGVFFFLTSVSVQAQLKEDLTFSPVDLLVKLGFENVSCTESESERVYVIENAAYRLSGVGISKAIDCIQSNGLPLGKNCRIIVLDNNVPQISLFYHRNNQLSVPQQDSIKIPAREGWEVSCGLGDNWKEARKAYRHNSSLFKVDIVVYPEVSLKNLVITQVYQVLFNLSPAIEVSFWKGMKFTAQMVFPIYNDGYSVNDSKIHPRVIALSQSFRLPWRGTTFARISAGLFYSDRYGVDLKVKHIFNDARFSAEGRISYTGPGGYEGFRFHYGSLSRVTWSLGGSFYLPLYNTQFSLKAEKYLLEEKGVRFDMTRHFRYCSVGFYAMAAQHANKNGGFRFQIALPPYKYKRKWLRVTPSKQMGMAYNAGNERYYYKTFRALPEDNMMKENEFNPYFITSELFNY
ncbi:hypothetical protein [Phocaeicola sp.]